MSERFWSVGPQGWGVYARKEGVLEPVPGEAEFVLSPGFVDVHVHGHAGIDFMAARNGDLQQMADRLEALGYEAFLPTTITADLESVLRALHQLPEDDARIPGFHLEGPFISPAFPGAQPPEFIRDGLTRAAWREVLEHPALKLITLAAEIPGGLEMTRELAQRGVRVSLGHTNATYAEAVLARESGATSLTHTFNAMRPLHHREPGMVGFALLHPEHFAELIYDRVHVSPDSARLLLSPDRRDTLVAVSDGTAASGMRAGETVAMWGHSIDVRSDRIVLAGTDTLAGSRITLHDAFRNLWVDAGPEWAIRACCLNPRRLLGWSSAPRVWLRWSMEGELLEIL